MNDRELPSIVAPPPVIYVGALLLGIAMHILYPMDIFSAVGAPQLLGGALFVVSGAFARWAFVTMRSSGTTGNPKKASTALVTTGPFRLSRNPIYLAMTGLYVGLALAINSVWLLVSLIPALILMQWGVIQREEKYLATKFGTAYVAYQSRVRRWL